MPRILSLFNKLFTANAAEVRRGWLDFPQALSTAKVVPGQHTGSLILSCMFLPYIQLPAASF